LTEREFAREEERKRRVAEAGLEANIIEIHRLLHLPVPAQRDVLCKPNAAHGAPGDNPPASKSADTKRKGSLECNVRLPRDNGGGGGGE
jgi:hypothetical protein